MTESAAPTKDYRPEIDGLRAIAVMMVVGYHAFPELIPGGFVGVDVFFVISGYLISNIIFKELQRGKFDFLDFFSRRIRRIFPALILILIACLIVGWFLLWAEEYLQLSKHTLSAATFTSNIIFWLEAGYFDNAAEVKPLLHLWSLAIEEQFYLIWPLLVWLFTLRRIHLLAPIIALGATSFLLNIWLIRTSTISAFYLPLPRSWELLLGGFLALITNPLAAHNSATLSWFQDKVLNQAWLYRTCTIIGPSLLILSPYLIDKTKVFPGFWALIPTFGAACVIFSASTSLFNRHVLSSRLLVWLGLISFPLYLWHWPLLSFARIAQNDVPSTTIRIFLVGISIVLAWLTYHFVERPFRRPADSRAKALVLIVLLAILGIVAALIIQNKGVLNRPIMLSGQSTKATADAGGVGVAMTQYCGIKTADIPKVYHCLSDPRETPHFALIGDSKALALLPGLVRTSTEGGRWLSINGVTPAPKDSPIRERDEIALQVALDALIKNKDIQVVAIVNGARTLLTPRGYSEEALMQAKSYQQVFEAVATVTNELIKHNKKIVFVLDNPTLANPEDCLVRNTGFDSLTRFLTKENPRCSVPVEKHDMVTRKYKELFARLKQQYPAEVFVFDTAPLLCDQAEGLCKSTQNDRVMYSYSDHISDYAAGLVGQKLNDFIKETVVSGSNN